MEKLYRTTILWCKTRNWWATGLPILVEEVKVAIYSMKSGKAPGPGGIQVVVKVVGWYVHEMANADI